MNRSSTKVIFAILAAGIFATQAALAMEMKADGVKSGYYVDVGRSVVIYYDSLTSTVQTVKEVDTSASSSGSTSTTSKAFTCTKTTVKEGKGCIKDSSYCVWTGTTTGTRDWWVGPYLEADLQEGSCSIVNVRASGDSTLTQFRAGMRAAEMSSESQLVGKWGARWELRWVDANNSLLTSFLPFEAASAPICDVNPNGDADEYEGFHDSTLNMHFVSCVWDATTAVNVTDRYAAALASGNPDKAKIAGFRVKAQLDNPDDLNPPMVAEISCDCLGTPSTGGSGGGSSGGDRLLLA